MTDILSLWTALTANCHCKGTPCADCRCKYGFDDRKDGFCVANNLCTEQERLEFMDRIYNKLLAAKDSITEDDFIAILSDCE